MDVTTALFATPFNFQSKMKHYSAPFAEDAEFRVLTQMHFLSSGRAAADVTLGRPDAEDMLGLGLLGLLQVALLVLVAGVSLTVSGTFDVLSQGLGVLALVLAWYVLGFALYATLFALAGSVVSRVEDLQTTVTPVIVLLVGSLYLVQFSIQSPSSFAATLAAVLPFSAPLAQPVRYAAGVGSAWQVVAAIGLTVLLLAVLVPLAARLYAGAALVTRGRASYLASLRRSGGQ